MKVGTSYKDQREADPLEFREATPTPSSIASKIGAKNLLIIIVTMPFVFLVVVMAIIAVFGRPGEEKAASVSPGAVRSTPVVELNAPADGQRVVLPMPASAESLAKAIALPEGAKTGAMALDGNRLAIRVDSDEGAMIVIYDLEADEVVKTIPLTTAPAGEND